MLIICALDDPLGLPAGSIELHSVCAQIKLNVALTFCNNNILTVMGKASLQSTDQGMKKIQSNNSNY